MNQKEILEQIAPSRITIGGNHMKVLGPIMTFNLTKHYSELLIGGVGAIVAGTKQDLNTYQNSVDEVEDEIKRIKGALEIIREDKIKKDSNAVNARLEDIMSVVEYLEKTIYPDVLALLLLSKGTDSATIYNIIYKTIDTLNKADVDQKKMSKKELRAKANSLLEQYLLKFRALGKIYYDSYTSHHVAITADEYLKEEEDMLEIRIRKLVNDAARPLVYVTHFLKVAESGITDRIEKTGINPDTILDSIVDDNPNRNATVN